MIDLYTWTTPNGRKVSIMLEELALPYTAHAVDITKDEQFAPDFLAISPNNKIPAIVDHDTGTHLMESGAILLYLADKTGQYAPTQADARWEMMEWLMFQMASVGPMLGQAHHFHRFNPGKAPYAEDRYVTETRRIYGVLEKRLADRAYILDDYSIVDMATWPWISRYEWQGIDFNDFPHLKRWYGSIAARPAVQRGYAVPKVAGDIPLPA